jgi:hypothetical protein
VVEILIYVFILGTTPLVAHIDSFKSLGLYNQTLQWRCWVDGASHSFRLVKVLMGSSSPLLLSRTSSPKADNDFSYLFKDR